MSWRDELEKQGYSDHSSKYERMILDRLDKLLGFFETPKIIPELQEQIDKIFQSQIELDKMSTQDKNEQSRVIGDDCEHRYQLDTDGEYSCALCGVVDTKRL